MAVPNNIVGGLLNLPANTDLSAKQYYAVDCNSSGKAAVSGAGAVFVGILQNEPAAADRGALIQYSGVTPMVAGGTVAAGDAVKIDSNGKGVAASSADKAIGRALSGAASGGQFNLLILPHTVA